MSEKLEPEKCIGFSHVFPAPFSAKDACTFALGIGHSQDPLDPKDLEYTYELSENFQVNPVITTIWSATFNPFDLFVAAPGIPRFNPMMLLHGEHKTVSYKPLDPNGSYINKSEIYDVEDKGKGALITILIKTCEKTEDGKPGDCVVENYLSLFIRGLGGFGFKGKHPESFPSLPKTAPTKVLVQQTNPNQALIYRLTGDVNPLHVDVNMAEIAGFEKPILHGLCTYGITSKLIIQNFCDNSANRLKAVKTRFTSHVFPGECIELKTWYDGNGQILFEGTTRERGKQVVMGYAIIEPSQKL